MYDASVHVQRKSAFGRFNVGGVRGYRKIVERCRNTAGVLYVPHTHKKLKTLSRDKAPHKIFLSAQTPPTIFFRKFEHWIRATMFFHAITTSSHNT